MLSSKELEIYASIKEFLMDIGIPVEEDPLTGDTFLPGLTVQEGRLQIDLTQLKYPGDILHEAGHIAVTPAKDRPLIGTDAMQEEWPKNGQELASLLWSLAACKHLDFPLDVVFHPHGYKNDAAWLIEEFNRKNYIGLPILLWMGLVEKEEDFPSLKNWLRT